MKGWAPVPALVDAVEAGAAPAVVPGGALGVAVGVVVGVVLGGAPGVGVWACNVRIEPSTNAAVETTTKSRRFILRPLPSSLPRPMDATLAADTPARPARDADHTRR